MDHNSKFIELGGILPAIFDQFVPLPLSELRDIEQWLGTTIPESFRQLVLNYGAFSFGCYISFSPLTPLPPPISMNGKGHFGNTYGTVIRENESVSLKWRIDCYRSRMPHQIIPIGDDSGNQICLGIEEEHRGKIYYWDHHNEITDYDDNRPAFPMFDKEKWRNVYLIAESFDDFINRLYVADT